MRSFRLFVPSALIAAIPFVSHAGFESDSGFVRIWRINEAVGFRQPTEIDVSPGERVEFSADLFEIRHGDETPIRAFRNRNEFVWQAQWEDSRGWQEQECYLSDDIVGKRCDLKDTNFETRRDGVAFYVPRDVYDGVTVSVRYRGRQDAEDWVFLANRDFTPESVNPTEDIEESVDYDHDTDTDTYGLTGHGDWVQVETERYWVPRRVYVGWSPYQNGRWTWSDMHGWVWVSYDPWGWYTDHYGFWRYHMVHGWIWHPHPRRVWRPHSVTFFFGVGGYIAWYPFCFDYWSAGWYRLGYAAGFADGYWDGYWDGRRSSHYYAYSQRRGWRSRPGVISVPEGRFVSANVRHHRYRDKDGGLGWLRNSADHRGPLPGVRGDRPATERDVRDSRGWVERRVTDRIPRAEIRTRTTERGVVKYPERIDREPPRVERRTTREGRDGIQRAPEVRTREPRVQRPSDGRREGDVRRPRQEPRPRIESQPAPRPRVESKPSPRPRAEPRPAPRPRVESQPAPRPRAESKPSPRPRAEPRPAPRPRVESQPAPRPRVESQPAPRPRAESKPAPRPKVESQPAPRPRAESKPAPKPRKESESRPKSGEKRESRPSSRR